MESNANLQVGVKILIKNNDKKYLLLRRSIEKYPEVRGRWDIPGGRIDPGKTLFDNLKREVREETNLEAIESPKLIAAQDILKNNRHIVRLTYAGNANGNVIIDPNEHDMYKWHSWEEMLELNDLDVYLKELLNNESLWEN